MISSPALFDDFQFFLENWKTVLCFLRNAALAFIFPGWQQLSKHVSDGFKNTGRDRTKTHDVLEFAILNKLSRYRSNNESVPILMSKNKETIRLDVCTLAYFLFNNPTINTTNATNERKTIRSRIKITPTPNQMQAINY